MATASAARTDTRASDSLFRLTGVVKAFGGIRALDGVDLAVAAGEIRGLIGPNGSGKTTLFNVMSGLIKPDAGQLIFRGRDVTRWRAFRIARAGLGRTFQIPALFGNLTVLDNLRIGGLRHRWSDVDQRAGAIIDLLELQPVRDQLAAELSGGQQRLLEFGRVMMRDPDIILLDEVMAGVHVNIRELIAGRVKDLRQQEGKAFLVIEHDMERVADLCERIIVMDKGTVVANGSFAEISRDPRVIEAYLGDAGD